MGHWCNICKRTFPTMRSLRTHGNRVHKYPKPPPPQPSTFRYHPRLNARPCDAQGNFLPPNTPPPPRAPPDSWHPYEDRASFEMSELLITKMHASNNHVNELLRILAAKRAQQTDGQDDANGFFDNAEHMFSTTDASQYGEAPWFTYQIRLKNPEQYDAPWARETYELQGRNPLHVFKNMAANPEFDGKWDYVPHEEYIGPRNRLFRNYMSGRHAWKQADEIARDPATHGSMLVTAVLGADKTTVSVATGHQEYHPLYGSPGNVSNEMRRSHGEALTLLAFLPIPKTAREYADTDAFRVFKKQLYHAAIARVLEPLQEWMTSPLVIRCPDGHYRRAVFELGPFIADYPEQVFVSGIVQGWCPKCRARPDNLENAGAPRFRDHTECMMENLDALTLWDVFGVVNDVVPFTYRFPRADIHALISPDILHQVIKGTFKDHLVSWVEEYVRLSAPSDAEADRIMDDIDRRIATAPSFPGLRRFPEGRNFAQWTGNDSKALMKVFLPAIQGHVPDGVVECIAAFMNFCYLTRLSAHDTNILKRMRQELARFHATRHVFEDLGIRPDGFSLPCQHSLVHYVHSIQLFGSPNGLCSSITESKHISAVKIPWRSSSCYNAIGQMLRTNTRCAKIAAARVEFGRCGMLQDDVHTYTLRSLGLPVVSTQAAMDARFRDERDAADADGPTTGPQVMLATRPTYVLRLEHFGMHDALPQLRECIRRFLYEQLYPELEPGDAVPLDECPHITSQTRIGVYHSMSATFFAPSEATSTGGMHREMIRCNPSWYGQYARYDTVLVLIDPDRKGMRGMLVARILLFFTFTFQDTKYSCAYVEWFETLGDEPDAMTGMWKVRPERDDRGERVVGVIDIDSILRACHLMPVFGATRMPIGLHFSASLDAFNTYYVNRYIDYHTFETVE